MVGAAQRGPERGPALASKSLSETAEPARDRTGISAAGPVRAGSAANRRIIGAVLAAGGLLAISTDSVITRAADADGWDVAFWYGVFTTPAMVAALFATERGRPRRAWDRSGPIVVVSGLLQMVSTLAFILAVKNTTVANVVVIIAAAPLVTAILAWVLLGERVGLRLASAIALAFAGIVVVVSGSLGGGGLVGDLLAVVAIVGFGLNLVVWRRHPDLSRTLVVAIGGVATSLVAAWPAQILGHSARTYLLVALMGAVFGPVGRISLASATRYLPAAEVSLFAPIETVSATAMAWAFFGERPTVRVMIGAVVITTAVVWGSVLGRDPDPATHDPPG